MDEMTFTLLLLWLVKITFLTKLATTMHLLYSIHLFTFFTFKLDL